MSLDKYIKQEEYKQIKGIDLAIEIQNDDNKSNKVYRFIHEVTDWCAEYLTRTYGHNALNPNIPENWEKLPEWRQRRFREGVIEQMEYILNNGWLNKDSGVNVQTGTIMNFDAVQLSRNAYQKFFLGAFCNIERTY